MGDMHGIHLDPHALDDAVAAASFTGVATVDAGDQRLLERCEGLTIQQGRDVVICRRVIEQTMDLVGARCGHP